MDVSDLVDQSAATALARVHHLQEHMREAEEDTVITECRAEIHQLVGDIVSLRNAAELLKRELRDDLTPLIAPVA